ncbi:unnamed protein product [Camellia sinensis]
MGHSPSTTPLGRSSNMASSASLPIISGGLSISTSLSSSSSSSSINHSSTVFKNVPTFRTELTLQDSQAMLLDNFLDWWGLRRDQETKLFTHRTKGQAVRVLANPNVCITQGFHMYNADIFGLNMLKGFFRVTPRKAEKKEVIMVDPLEAKRLAAKQMAEIKEKERLKDGSHDAPQCLALKFSYILEIHALSVRIGELMMGRREIEAINGAWAMIGLTAGLLIEGHTGNSILSQLAGYWAAIVHFFVR